MKNENEPKAKMVKMVKMNPRVDACTLNGGKQTELEMCDKTGSKCIRFFVDVTETGLPLIRINEGDFKGLVFLVDSGSNDNLMFGYAFHQLEDYMKPTDVESNLFGLDGKSTVSKCVCGTFSFCGKKYDMSFVVSENNDAIIKVSLEVGFPISGIIGTKFMAEHEWVIDFGKQEIIIPAHDVTSADLNKIRNRKKAIK